MSSIHLRGATFFVSLHLLASLSSRAQQVNPHVNAHAHNDYEHTHPLFDALSNGFTSVEADVHLVDERLLVSHDKPGKEARTLEALYLKPLDSLIRINRGTVYVGYSQPVFLMIDCKTAPGIYPAILNAVAKFPKLMCAKENCAVKIFLSGNRPLSDMVRDGYRGLGIDGHPEDVGKGYSPELMPVISDHYGNWSSWKATSPATPSDLQKIRELAKQVHSEGKKLRLWAIPDREEAWKALLDAGVDMINTDRLAALSQFLTKEGR